MFDKKKGSHDVSIGLPPAPPPSPQQGKRGMFSVIGTDVTITGSVAASADLHIDGRIDGDVHCGSLIQGPESRIKGSVNADIARIGGTVEGGVNVRQLTIERNAKIIGDVAYETIAIENGAHIDGRLKHQPPGAPAAPTRAPANEAGDSMRLVAGGEA